MADAKNKKLDPLDVIATLADDFEGDPATDAQLAAARADLADLIDQATAEDTPDLELARELTEAVKLIDAEKAKRKEARESAAAEAAELRRQVGLGGDDDQADEGEDADQTAEDVETSTEDAEDEGTEDAATKAEKELTPVAASVISKLRAAADARTPKTPPAPPRGPDVQVRPVGVAASAELDNDSTLRDVAKVFARFGPHVQRKSASALVRIESNYPEARRLGEDSDRNTRLLDSVTGPRAVTASGGLCQPLEADFSHPICGDRGRPIRDALPSFQADRGGIRFIPSASLGDLSGAVSVWTTTDDEQATGTKPCPAVECETETLCEIEAITACLTVGNFQARFSPELWESRLDLLMLEHDRLAEQQLLAEIDANSTPVAFGGTAGTYRNLVGALMRARAYFWDVYRVNQPLRAIIPATLQPAVLSDNVHEDDCECAQIDLGAQLTRLGIRPIWTPDDGGAASPTAFDATANVRVFPEGTFTFLDGGTLDLGTEITDSTLNQTNDRQAFMETFEKVCFRGCESLDYTVNVADVCGCA